MTRNTMHTRTLERLADLLLHFGWEPGQAEHHCLHVAALGSTCFFPGLDDVGRWWNCWLFCSFCLNPWRVLRGSGHCQFWFRDFSSKSGLVPTKDQALQWCWGSVTARESAPPDPSCSHFLLAPSPADHDASGGNVQISSYLPPWWAQIFAWSGGYSVEIT